MSQQRWCANVAASGLSTTAKTLINLIAGAADRINAVVEISVSVDSATPIILVELCESTQAGAGTPGTAPTLKQMGGFSAADGVTPGQVTVAGNYTAEPTALTRLKAWRFQGPGPFVMQHPLGREPESLNSGSTKYRSLALRVTASVGTPACDAHMEFE